MAKNGMVAVENPSQLFLDMREEERNGFSGAIAVTMEGSRPFLVEIQVSCFFFQCCQYSRCELNFFFLSLLVLMCLTYCDRTQMLCLLDI